MDNGEYKELRRPPKIGITRGTFKLIHRGHVEMLHKCANLVDKLYVLIDSGARLEQLGKWSPYSESERVILLKGLKSVHEVLIFDDELHFQKRVHIISNVYPASNIFYFKGGDYRPMKEDIPEMEFLKGKGITTMTVELTPGVSTTEIFDEIASVWTSRKYKE